MKLFKPLIFTLLASLCLTNSAAYAQGTIFGDVNNDQAVDLLDIQLEVNIILGVTGANTAADLSGDGNVDAIDLQRLTNIVLGSPTLQTVVPASGIETQTITITGANFGTVPGNVTVLVSNNVPANAISAQDNQIEVVVPIGAASGPLLVQVTGQTAPSNNFNFTVVPGVMIGGTVSAGPVNNAQVDIFLVDPTTGDLTLVGTVMTGPTGQFTFVSQTPGVFLAIARGGTYKDEATGVMRSLGMPALPTNINDARDNSLETLLDSASATTVTASVTPLTSIASQRAISASQGSGMAVNPAMIDSAAMSVANELGLVDGNGNALDPRDIAPVDLTDGNNAGVDPASPEAIYGALLGGLSQAAADAGVAEPLDFVRALQEDFSDGVFDGQMDNQTVMLGNDPLSTTAATGELQDGTQNFLNSDNNASGNDASMFNELLDDIATRDEAPPGVNIAPSFQANVITVFRSANPIAVSAIIKNITAGTSAEDLAGQQVTLTLQGSSNQGIVQASNISLAPGQTPDKRLLIFTPEANVVGSTMVTIQATDNGSTPKSVTRTVIINVINNPPKLDLNGSAAGTTTLVSTSVLGGPISLVNPGATLTDADDTMMESATATIVGGPLDANMEILGVTTSNANLTVNYDGSTGVLTITGSETLAAYLQVLKTLTYDNAATNPNGATRTVSVSVNDGDDDGLAQSLVGFQSLAIQAGNNQTSRVGSTLQNGLIVQARDGQGAILANVPVTFAVTAGAGSFASQNSITVVTGPNGLASATLTLGANVGVNTVTASSTGFVGSPLTFSVTGTLDPVISSAGGDGQTGLVSTALANPFAVELRDINGDLASGVDVTFTVTAGSGTVAGQSSVVVQTVNGLASTVLTLGPNTGLNTVTATATGFLGSPVTFNATAEVPAVMSLVSGNNQTGTATLALLAPLTVRLTGTDGLPVAGQAVVFDVTSGGGALSGSNSFTATTNSNGRASATLTLGPNPGSQTVTATAAGFNGSPVTFTASSQVPRRILAVAGNNQTGQVNTTLPTMLVVKLTDELGQNVS
ncbi:MAG: IPT/TIG domain-containing protein, partial [Planctomycetota bacterium]|nr:IPT/TIG domain-containing protein [Planctomycetota bacterium]